MKWELRSHEHIPIRMAVLMERALDISGLSWNDRYRTCSRSLP
jgi:hypothetical protein